MLPYRLLEMPNNMVCTEPKYAMPLAMNEAQAAQPQIRSSSEPMAD